MKRPRPLKEWEISALASRAAEGGIGFNIDGECVCSACVADYLSGVWWVAECVGDDCSGVFRTATPEDIANWRKPTGYVR